jgi:hypothetical protein
VYFDYFIVVILTVRLSRLVFSAFRSARGIWWLSVGLYIDLAMGGISEVNQSDRGPSIRRSLPDPRNETPTSRDSFTLKMATATLAKTSGNLH